MEGVEHKIELNRVPFPLAFQFDVVLRSRGMLKTRCDEVAGTGGVGPNDIAMGSSERVRSEEEWWTANYH